MPTVPQYGEPKVREQALPSVRVSTDAPAAAFGYGDATEKAFNLSQQIMEKERQKAVDVANTELDSFLSQEQTRIQTQASKLKLKDAAGAEEFVKSEWDKTLENAGKQAKSADSQFFLNKAAVSRYDALNRFTQAHIANELEKHDDVTTESAIKSYQNEATMNYKDPEARQTALERIGVVFDKYAERKGLPPEVAQEKKGEVLSGSHRSIIEQMTTAGDDLSAKAYYENLMSQEKAAGKPLLAEKDRKQIQSVLQESSIRGESQRLADSIYGKYAGDEKLAYAEAGKVADPKVRDALEQRLEHLYSRQTAMQNRQQSETYRNAFNAITKSKSLDAVPPAMMASLDPANQTSLRNYAKLLATGGDVVTDMVTYQDLRTMAATPETREAFLKTDLVRNFGTKVGHDDLMRLLELQAGLRGKDDKITSQLDGYLTQKDIVDEQLKAAGFDLSNKASQDELEQIAKFHKKVDAEISRRQMELGKKLKNEEVQDIAATFLRKQKVPTWGGWWSTDKRLFEIDPEKESIALDIKDIPRDDRVRIENALKSRGQKVDEASIMLLYRAKISKMVKRAN